MAEVLEQTLKLAIERIKNLALVNETESEGSQSELGQGSVVQDFGLDIVLKLLLFFFKIVRKRKKICLASWNLSCSAKLYIW